MHPHDERTEGDTEVPAVSGEAPEATPSGHGAGSDALGDLDDDPAVETPEVAVAESLRTALSSMRSESDRIAELGTGEEQVEAAERFAEDAGRLDEQVGAAARRADDDDRR